jgi:hypothetical protein
MRALPSPPTIVPPLLSTQSQVASSATVSSDGFVACAVNSLPNDPAVIAADWLTGSG